MDAALSSLKTNVKNNHLFIIEKQCLNKKTYLLVSHSSKIGSIGSAATFLKDSPRVCLEVYDCEYFI